MEVWGLGVASLRFKVYGLGFGGFGFRLSFCLALVCGVLLSGSFWRSGFSGFWGFGWGAARTRGLGFRAF